MARTDVGAFAAVVDDSGRVLIAQERKQPHRFGFPGGRVEDGETPELAVVRECLEETGLTVRVVDVVGRYGFTNGQEAVLLLCAVQGEGALRSEPGSYAGWHHPAQIPTPVRSTLHYGLPDVLAGRREVRRTGLAPISP